MTDRHQGEALQLLEDAKREYEAYMELTRPILPEPADADPTESLEVTSDVPLTLVVRR